MRVGIFGSNDDPQCHAVATELRKLGAEDVLLRDDALEKGLPLSVVDGRYVYRGVDVEDLHGFYLRSIPAPYAPAMEQDDTLVLYDDWFVRYMHQREQASFMVAWLLALQQRGRRIVNGPHAASVLQYKPYQLHVLRTLGADVPRTLISNDPDAVRAFTTEVKDVIFKPVMGGAITERVTPEVLERIEQVRASPVIFQERIDGDDLRVMLLDGKVISSVAIVTPSQHLDFRDDPVYSEGEASYREVKLPKAVERFCARAAKECGLVFAGIDIKKTSDGRWVFLELNSSPIYLDVERKLGHGISAALARVLTRRKKS